MQPNFEGGLFSWLDEDSDLAVEPRAGRLLTFTGGLENVHGLSKASLLTGRAHSLFAFREGEGWGSDDDASLRRSCVVLGTRLACGSLAMSSCDTRMCLHDVIATVRAMSSQRRMARVSAPQSQATVGVALCYSSTEWERWQQATSSPSSGQRFGLNDDLRFDEALAAYRSALHRCVTHKWALLVQLQVFVLARLHLSAFLGLAWYVHAM